MAVIDADAHVVETERTWEFVNEDEQGFKPAVLVSRHGKTPAPEYWFIDGRVFAKGANIGLDTPDGARELSDVKKRVAHMDELGVDVHVLYPTLFLRAVTRHPEIERALYRSYNRWLADIWKQAPDRMRWACMVPLMNMDWALEELHFAKEHGACGVFTRGLEWSHRLSDPYLFPLYEEASKLDMPICVHSGVANMDYADLFMRDSGFSAFKLAVVGAFHDLVMKGTPEKFPDLRWVFVEVSAQWLPYALNDAGLRLAKAGKQLITQEVMKDYRMYVACQTTDDFDWILNCVGDENIMIGTDYGHADTSSEIEALRTLRESGAMDKSSAEKILNDNPRRAYAL